VTTILLGLQVLAPKVALKLVLVLDCIKGVAPLSMDFCSFLWASVRLELPPVKINCSSAFMKENARKPLLVGWGVLGFSNLKGIYAIFLGFEISKLTRFWFTWGVLGSNLLPRWGKSGDRLPIEYLCLIEANLALKSDSRESISLMLTQCLGAFSFRGF